VTDLALYEYVDGIATITLNRPHRLNAITVGLVEDLRSALDRSVADAARVVILTGAGRGFCAGGDLAPVANEVRAGAGGPAGAPVKPSTLSADLETAGSLGTVTRQLYELPAVTIAAINGACAGAGLSLACACDVRFAADTARFNTAFLTAGLPGDYGITWTLPRVVGLARARELFFAVDRFGAVDAAGFGLVASVHPADELLGHCASVAGRLAAAPPLALRGLKANINDNAEHGLAEALSVEVGRLVPCLRSEDFREAARAFRDKRAPIFHGR
jgi:2-(1,2-epoxy-1,2-dihydrophenyl)acetyl-CoA isomerase